MDAFEWKSRLYRKLPMYPVLFEDTCFLGSTPQRQINRFWQHARAAMRGFSMSVPKVGSHIEYGLYITKQMLVMDPLLDWTITFQSWLFAATFFEPLMTSNAYAVKARLVIVDSDVDHIAMEATWKTPSGNDCCIAMENGHWNREFSHLKLWFSIVM